MVVASGDKAALEDSENGVNFHVVMMKPLPARGHLVMIAPCKYLVVKKVSSLGFFNGLWSTLMRPLAS